MCLFGPNFELGKVCDVGVVGVSVCGVVFFFCLGQILNSGRCVTLVWSVFGVVFFFVVFSVWVKF